jgi:hypothetical protein
MAITLDELNAEWTRPGTSMRDVKTPGGRKGMITDIYCGSGLTGPYEPGHYEPQITLTVQVLSQQRPYIYAPEDLDWWTP